MAKQAHGRQLTRNQPSLMAANGSRSVAWLAGANACRSVPSIAVTRWVQRHHILPRQLLSRTCFHPLLKALGREQLHFDDFRHNGLLLPANDAAAVRIGLPLHRGPHRDYNAMVIERVGQIEAGWSARRPMAPEVALAEALEGLRQLQHNLRQKLLDQHHRLTLNRRDPLGSGLDFSGLDGMADVLWPAIAPTEA